MLKKILCLIMTAVLLAGVSIASADTVDLNIPVRDVEINYAGLNVVDSGISPTTGLTLADYDVPDGFSGLAATGRYMPVLIQIDNSEGGIGNRAPWNGSYADIVYETPLYKRGVTRLSYLFSDLIPDMVGPTRSTRLNHLWIREEWDCAFAFWGSQKYVRTSVETEITRLGLRDKNILFDGTTGGKAWNPYAKRSGLLKKPNNAYWMLAGLVEQVVPADYVPANHTYKFADDIPEDGDDAEFVEITWGDKEYSSRLEYDEDENVYYRYMTNYAEDKDKNYGLYDQIEPVPEKNNKIKHTTPITFSNVIVQCMEIEYPNLDAPLPTVVGTGNAEYFMGGKHISGVWNRDTLQDRTVFYDMDGNEIELQRGHTLIVMLDYKTEGRSLSYSE